MKVCFVDEFCLKSVVYVGEEGCTKLDDVDWVSLEQMRSVEQDMLFCIRVRCFRHEALG